MSVRNRRASSLICWKCGQRSCDSVSCAQEATVLKSGLSEPTQSKLKYYALDLVRKENDRPTIAKLFRQYLETTLKGFWHCVVGGRLVGVDVSPRDDCYITIKVSEIYIMAWRSKKDKSSCFKCGVEFCDGTNCKLENPVILKGSFNNELKTKVTEIVQKTVKKQIAPSIIASDIRDGLESTYGPHWHVIVRTMDSFHSMDLAPHVHHFISLKISNLNVVAFKSRQDKLCWKCGSRLCEFKYCELKDPIVLKTTMEQEMQIMVCKSLIDAMQRNEAAKDAASHIKLQLLALFGGRWQCFIGGSSVPGTVVGYGISPMRNRFLEAKVSNARVIVFQTQSTRLNWSYFGSLVLVAGAAFTAGVVFHKIYLK